MNDNLYASIILFAIGVFFLIYRFKYPVKDGDMKWLLNFQSLLIGIGCIICTFIALLRHFDILI